MFNEQVPALPVLEMYKEFSKNRRIEEATIEIFEGVDGLDVYNPSVPFIFEGKEYIAGRVERRDSERSEIRFFTREGDRWVLAEGTVTLPLQDPFVTFVGNTMVLGGVHVDWPEKPGDVICWYTDFYTGTPYELTFLTRGPRHMKDVRIVALPDGKIALCSRPQGACMAKYHCTAKIGFDTVAALSELSPEVIEAAPYLEKLFCDSEWGGANQLTVLKNGMIGVIGHKACRTFGEEGHKLHYYGIAFAIDPKTGKFTQNKMIISGDCFPTVDAKRSDLTDVTFTAGILRLPNGKARVYTGLNDTHVGSAIIDDPFLEYEAL